MQRTNIVSNIFWLRTRILNDCPETTVLNSDTVNYCIVIHERIALHARILAATLGGLIAAKSDCVFVRLDNNRPRLVCISYLCCCPMNSQPRAGKRMKREATHSENYIQNDLFLPRDALVHSAVLRLHVVRPSVCNVGGSESHRLEILETTHKV